MTDRPRVRVVVLNYEGGDTTLACLRSVLQTDWPPDRLDVVMVDNASYDGVTARVRQELPGVRVIESPVNLGFAGGCNLGLQELDEIDHVALLNNDTTVEPGWLAPLVDALEQDPTYGAASPKILFADPMVEIELTAETHRRGRGDQRELGVRVTGARVDGRDVWSRLQAAMGFWGPEPSRLADNRSPERTAYWTHQVAILRVPDGARCELRLDSDRPTQVSIRSGAVRAQHIVGAEPAWYRTPIAGRPLDVINNTGTILVADGYCADRGLHEVDRGQYGRARDVFAWCGAAVLLRREYLQDVGLFDERLFLYYEDVELSWRGAEHGWRYRYVPESVVRHIHSSATITSSALHDHYSERNHLLVLSRHAPATLLTRAVVRYVLVTASYARRDVGSPLLRGKAPTFESVGRRVRSFTAFLRGAPGMLRDRSDPASQVRLPARST